jgi:hypothetical protein
MKNVSFYFRVFVIGTSIIWCSPNYGATCTHPVQPIKEGQQAQCNGYLFSPETEEAAYKATRIVELQEKENKILEERLQLYKSQSESLAKDLGKKKSSEEFIRIGYFAFGAIITGIIASNISK